MKVKKQHTVFVLGATLLFGVLTLLHEYDWLLPQSPVDTVVSTSQVPLPDVIEEHGSEDEIEHEDSEPFYVSSIQSVKGSYMIYEDLFVPHVSTPPPDII
ncbi:hypothetical protein ACKGJO_13985 [Gracilimonas sp. Q87]|uniref:hypothetical protein n=1 Tax=Gracilimonas sp. Q87 TaxID=3384766 RepID=UPI00398424FB